MAQPALKMRQTLDDLESRFSHQVAEDQARRAHSRRAAARRNHQRMLDRNHKHGSLRFVALVLALLGTAALVTVVMFRVLYVVMG